MQNSLGNSRVFKLTTVWPAGVLSIPLTVERDLRRGQRSRIDSAVSTLSSMRVRQSPLARQPADRADPVGQEAAHGGVSVDAAASPEHLAHALAETVVVAVDDLQHCRILRSKLHRRVIQHAATPRPVPCQPAFPVLQAFPTLAAAEAWHDSPAYREIVGYRVNSTRCNAVSMYCLNQAAWFSGSARGFPSAAPSSELVP